MSNNARQLSRSLVGICHTHTHTQPFNGPLSRTTRVSRYQKGKPIWILLKQETVSGISWAICKSAPRSRQITTSAPHHSVFLQAGCPSCHPTNSVKALKANRRHLSLARNKIWTVWPPLNPTLLWQIRNGTVLKASNCAVLQKSTTHD